MLGGQAGSPLRSRTSLPSPESYVLVICSIHIWYHPSSPCPTPFHPWPRAFLPAGEKKLTTVMLFGDQKAVETAERMIMEAIDNREQKAKNRQKEYEKKREAKRRERMLYHLRHAKVGRGSGLPWFGGEWSSRRVASCVAVAQLPNRRVHGHVAGLPCLQADGCR